MNNPSKSKERSVWPRILCASNRFLCFGPARRKILTGRGDLLEIDLPSGYDLIYGLDIFEHLNPNKLGAYVRKISEKMAEGGYLFCNIPAFGDDPVFGRLFPLYVKEWENEGRNHHPFQTLPVDEWGILFMGISFGRTPPGGLDNLNLSGLNGKWRLKRPFISNTMPTWRPGQSPGDPFLFFHVRAIRKSRAPSSRPS
jgi:hypothetical protein